MTTTTTTARNLKRAASSVVVVIGNDSVGGIHHLMTRQPTERCTPAPGYPAGCQDIDLSTRATEHNHAP